MRTLSKTTHQQKTLMAKTISIQSVFTNFVRRHGLLISLCLLSVIAITGGLLPGWASNTAALRKDSKVISEQLKARQAPLWRQKAPLSTTNILLGSRRDYPGEVRHLNLDYLGLLALATHWRSEGDIWSDLLRYVTRSNALAANAVFASITVTTTADTIDAAANCPSVTLASLPGPDGQISLREAICAANTNAGPDTITFSVNGTFALTGAANEDNGGTGDFDIKQSLTINGNGTANTILDGSGIERIFDVFPSAASTFDLSNLTIQNGDTRSTSFQEGGAMYLHNNVTATLNSIQVINNLSGANGAIETRGSLTINNSVISNNQTLPASGNVVGGGIRNAGTLTIDNTTISNNTVRGEGGGIATTTGAAVTVTITDSTISGNTASVTGGGNGNGGGISTTGNQGTINITNSTISGNRADANGGGAAFASVSGGAVTLTNVTITNNTADNDNNGSGAGGGFSQGNTTTVTLRNTIVAGNFNSTAATRDDISGAVVNTSSYNLIGDGTGMSGTTNGVNNNQVGSGASPINPLLSALSNNGGSTQTHALLSGSPAIDTGSTALAPATDQRGVTRPGGAAADIGAYEVSDTVPPDTTITGNPTNPSNSSSATFTFTGSDNVTPPGSLTFQCQLDSGGFSACTSPRNYMGLADSSHTFQVRAIDQAGNTDPTPASYTWNVNTAVADLTIDKRHSGNFTQGQTGAQYTIEVRNSGTGTTSGAVTVVDTLPAGLTATAMGGAGWNCTLATLTCTRSDALAANTSYPDIILTVNVASNAPPSVTNSAAVSGGGEQNTGNNTDNDPTTVLETTPPDTTITGNPNNPSNSSSGSFTFTGSDNVTPSGSLTFQCQLDGGGFSACTSPQNYMGLSQGSHTFQVRAVDGAGNIDPTPASYTWSTNSPPTIMAMTTSRTEGSPVSNSQIATVNDVEDAEDQLAVTVNGGASAMNGGITISNIVVSSTGIVTANVEAVCGAVTTDFTLRVTDTVGGNNEAILKVTVDPNTPPTLTYAASVAASLGQTLTVNPATGPADNGPNLVLAVESISAGFTGTASVASNGRVTINNAGPLGTHTFTIKATDNCGEITQTSFMLTVFPFIVQLSDPLICTDNGTTLAVHAEVTNPNAVAANLNFSATIPAPMSGVANTCVSSAGTCTVTANNVTVTGLIAPNQTVTIDYKVAVANGTPQGTQLCIDSTASFNGGPVAMIQACTQLNCPAGGVVQANAQKTGSVLVFPYYNSQAATQSDTRLTISNVGNVTANVHVFFIAGASCEAANLFICLTPRASFSFKASEYDPETTGWLLAVAVDDQGRPIRNNVLVGNGFVREGSYLGNYGAESFAARSGAVAAFPNNNTATLFFDGSSYDAVPDQFAVELQSPQEVPGQRLVTVGLRGDLTASQMSGAGQVGTGLLVNGNESPMSSFVSFLNGNCQAQAILTGTTPRVAGGVNTLIPPGQVGTMRWQIGAGVGLLMTPRGANGWSGIRNLHKTRATTSAITIPVFPPVC